MPGPFTFLNFPSSPSAPSVCTPAGTPGPPSIRLEKVCEEKRRQTRNAQGTTRPPRDPESRSARLSSPVLGRVPLHPHAVHAPFPITTHLSVTLATDTSKSSLLVPRTISFSPEMDGPQRLSPNTQKQGRRRRSSSIIYQEPPESIEHTSDQAALPNLNANWVNAKGE